MSNPKTVIVDDSPFDLLSIQEELTSSKQFNVIDAFLNGADFLQALQEKQLELDLLIMDYRMPILSGLDTLKIISTLKVDFKILIVSHGYYKNLYQEMQLLGYRNYCRKEPSSYLNAIPKLMRDVSIYSDMEDFNIWEQLSEKLGLKQKDESKWRNHLSPIELKIIRFICKGYNSKEIALKLGYETSSIEKYRGLIVKALELRSSGQLVSWAFAQGIVTPTSVFMESPEDYMPMPKIDFNK
jgi:DNA-binding NarL/FixJ family response regulator